MQEDFIHYIWKYKKLSIQQLKSSDGEVLMIKNFGQHNYNAGPDFFNAQIYIDEQLWAGNVEMHLKSSDWYVHNHETDKAYDNVILHVVWEHDTDVFRKDNSKITTLIIQNYVNSELLLNYKQLMHQKSWINCESDFQDIDDFIINNWLDKLYIERLEQKSEHIQNLLQSSNSDWEAVLFKMLAKNFGLKVNGDAFLSVAHSIPFSIIKKLQSNASDLEALLFGQSGLLDKEEENQYYHHLKNNYQYLKHKFKLTTDGVMPVQFFRLRPPNFPTVRLSQLSQLYFKYQSLFSEVMQLKTKDACYKLFTVSTSEFWKTHYTFSNTSKPAQKTLSKSFVDLLIINTIIPLQFSYAKYQGKFLEDHVFQFIGELKAENNTIVNKFFDLKSLKKSALKTQALIQLKQNYCNKNKCLHCEIGNNLINKK